MGVMESRGSGSRIDVESVEPLVEFADDAISFPACGLCGFSICDAEFYILGEQHSLAERAQAQLRGGQRCLGASETCGVVDESANGKRVGM